MSDYDWWRAALEGKSPEITADHPQCGRYRKRAHKTAPWEPVAIWRQDGVIKAAVGKTHVDPLHIWTWVAKHPVAQSDYKFAIENGHFPSEPPPIGDNSGNLPLQDLARDKLEQAETFLKGVTTKNLDQIQADLARNIQAGLLEIKGKADAEHKAEKQPFLDGGRAVDDKYRFRTDIDGISKRLRNVYEAFMKAEEDRLRKEAQEAYERERAAAEAERSRIEADRAKKMLDDPIAALTDPEPGPLPEIPTGPAEVRVTAGGGTGRRAGLKTEYVPVFDDFGKTLSHYADHPLVRDLVEKLVKAEVRIHKQATKIPGVTVKEDRRAA